MRICALEEKPKFGFEEHPNQRGPPVEFRTSFVRDKSTPGDNLLVDLTVSQTYRTNIR